MFLCSKPFIFNASEHLYAFTIIKWMMLGVSLVRATQLYPLPMTSLEKGVVCSLRKAKAQRHSGVMKESMASLSRTWRAGCCICPPKIFIHLPIIF